LGASIIETQSWKSGHETELSPNTCLTSFKILKIWRVKQILTPYSLPRLLFHFSDR